MKQGIYLGMRLVHVNADDIQMFLMTGNVGIRLANVDVIKDLFGIQVVMNVNVVNHAAQGNVQIIKIVNEKRLINKVAEEFCENID